MREQPDQANIQNGQKASRLGPGFSRTGDSVGHAGHEQGQPRQADDRVRDAAMKIEILLPDQGSEDVYVGKIGRNRENRGSEGRLLSQAGPAQSNAHEGMGQIFHAWTYTTGASGSVTVAALTAAGSCPEKVTPGQSRSTANTHRGTSRMSALPRIRAAPDRGAAC